MGQARFSDLTGNPRDARFRIAPQATRDIGIDDESKYVQFHAFGGGPAPEKSEIEDQVLSPSGNPVDGLTGKWGNGGDPIAIGTVDPGNEGMLIMLALTFGQYSVTADTPITGVTRWRFGLSEATAAVPYASLQINDQMTQIRRYTDSLFSGYTVTASPNAPYRIDFPFQYSHWDEFGTVTQTVGAASTLPIFKGSFDGQWAAEATDQDVYLRVDNISNIDVSGKITLAAAYSNAQTNESAAAYHRLYDETGARIGEFGDQVKYRFPAAPTLVALDEFKALRRRVPWSESLPTRRPISSVNTIFIVDGEEIMVPGGWSVNVAWSSPTTLQDTGGRQGSVLENSGFLGGTVNLTRPVLDLLFQKGLRTESTVTVVQDSFTKVKIGATIREYRFLEVLPQCIPTGAIFHVTEGGNDRDESPALIAKEKSGAAFAYDGMNFSDAVNVVVETDIVANADL